jgi:7-cyano-7-deazaguanine synthase in queuosine biosynthesis
MANALVVLHTGLSRKPRTSRKDFDERVDLYLEGEHQNLEIKVQNIEHKVLSYLSPVAYDLLELAAVLYVTDTSISRGKKDVYGHDWQRRIHIIMPVRKPKVWKSNQQLLSELVTYLSGDAGITFDFRPHRRPKLGQQYLEFPSSAEGFQGARRAVLFSGGLDSLAGAAELVAKNVIPLLISHRSSSTRTEIQNSLMEQLATKAGHRLPGIGVWVTRRDKQALDTSQRLRSFLYMSLAAVIAYELRIESVFFCENGITTFNLPMSDQRIGTRSSRTTNPKVIKLFRQLVENVTGRPICFENPFLLSTKREVVERLVQLGCAGMIKTSLSCARTFGVEKTKRHCGVCFQCVTRRFAVVAAKAEEHDPIDDYKKDIFRDSLTVGVERANAVDWVNFNRGMRELSLEALVQRFPQLYQALGSMDGDRHTNAKATYGLFQRNAEDVVNALCSKHAQHYSDVLAGRLPADSLLGLIGTGAHLRPRLADFLDEVATTLCPLLREAFRDKEPNDERELQNQAEVILKAAGHKVDREAPEFTFSVVKTRPDFSLPESDAFLELKLLKDRRSLVQVVDGILADIQKYRKKCGGMLFLVFQTSAIICDINEFLRDFPRDPLVGVKVIG